MPPEDQKQNEADNSLVTNTGQLDLLATPQRVNHCGDESVKYSGLVIEGQPQRCWITHGGGDEYSGLVIEGQPQRTGAGSGAIVEYSGLVIEGQPQPTSVSVTCDLSGLCSK